MRPVLPHLAALLVGLLCAMPADLRAQDADQPKPEDLGKAAAEPSLAELVGKAGEAQAQLRELEASLAPEPAFEALLATLPQKLEEFEARAREARERIEGSTQLRQLQDIENRWLDEQRRIEGVRDQLTGRATAIKDALTRIDETVARWEKSKQQAREMHAPAAVMTQIGKTLQTAATARDKVSAHANEVLGLQAEIGRALGIVADVLERGRLAQRAVRGGALGTDGLPLWTAILESHAQRDQIVARALEIRRAEFSDGLAYARRARGEIILHATILVLAVLMALALRPRALRWASEDAASSASAQVLARPYAAGLLIATGFAPILYPNAPSNWEELFLLLALLASLRVLPSILEPEIRRAFYALAVFFLLDRVRDLLVGTPLLARLLLLVELAGFAWLFGVQLSARRLALLPNADTRLALFVFVRRFALFLVGLAFFSSVLGYITLSRLVGDGLMLSAYGGVAVYGAYKVLSGMVGIFLRGRAFENIRTIESHRAALSRSLIRVLRVAALFVWVWGATDLFAVREPVTSFIVKVLSATLSVGELSLSLGGVIVFALAVLIAIYSARLVRYVLDEDVLPRMDLPRGVPYAISSISFYTLLLLGFIAAVAAAGIDLSGLALLGGALGVGIGFGLQNVVNNFVSGLILLFERPIKAGDTIEIGNLLGEVRQIGIRASTVRTWQGADVVVPNGNLLADQLINWTLGDRNRRIELDLGVAYGTDPERVIELLESVARADERVLDHPAPSALFMGFGDSSLDFRLRAWTSLSEAWMQIRSDMNVAINAALAEAGIEIPFPQRDLHVRSVDPEAGRALAPPRDRS